MSSGTCDDSLDERKRDPNEILEAKKKDNHRIPLSQMSSRSELVGEPLSPVEVKECIIPPPSERMSPEAKFSSATVVTVSEATLLEAEHTETMEGEEEVPKEHQGAEFGSAIVATATTVSETALEADCVTMEESEEQQDEDEGLDFSPVLGYPLNGVPNVDNIIGEQQDAPVVSQKKQRKTVRFDYVKVREFAITIGDHPFCARGVPLTLDWEYDQAPAVPLELWESTKRRRNKDPCRMLLSSYQRRNRLWRCGHPLEEIEQAAKLASKANRRQSLQLYFLPVYMLEELYLHQRDRLRRKINPKRSREAVLAANEAQVRQLHRQQLAKVDAEQGATPPWQQQPPPTREPPKRRVSFRGSSFQDEVSSSSLREPSGGDHNHNYPHHYSPANNSAGAPPSYNSDTHGDHSSVYSGSNYSSEVNGNGGRPFHRRKTYNIRTDPRQHDKATEIILCSIQRPHMRAFHGSWFGFFIGFVMWFAITPLLSEVKDTLHLTNADIWTSSMCGTAVTVVARVMMGPLCDVFGARRCMAVIVIVSAIPCGLTGLVNTAAGLSTVRAFIGIAGSAFVPCQYWTSRMFAREVAGTANALVAGWGNLGGGVTQLLMGSVLFPLFQLVFQDHDNASELAWRTVFVVPALIAFGAAYVYIFHCEDSPKGDFSELVRQQQIEKVSPFWSLGMAIQNRNVILLLIQYACCFGVEITMTNATALYMKDEFGLETVQAAAVASVFGIMNLFARGLGGYGSDYCNSRWGTKGRVVWQSVTLFLEGAGIVVFAFAETLVAAIFALIFLSLWVQCSEGSTYGIVPYVNRRFTGAVVGWIGGGGTMGGVIFSLFFREFSYRKAFVTMGLAAAGSSFLSVFLNVKSLTAIYHEKQKAEHIKNNNNFVFHDDAPIHFHREKKTRDFDA